MRPPSIFVSFNIFDTSDYLFYKLASFPTREKGMIEKLVSSPVLLALLAASMYGLGGPVMKMAGNAGATPNGLALGYALGALLVLSNWSGPTTLFTSPYAAALAALWGLMMGIAMRAVGQAFALPTGYISLVVTITAAYPLISTACGLIFFDEAARVVLGRMIIGSMMVVGGVYLVGTSVR